MKGKRNPFCLSNLSLLEVNDGNVWAGCPTGLFRWNGLKWEEHGASHGIRDNSFTHLIQGSNDILYVDTKSGLYQYVSKRDQWQPFPK